MMQTHTKLANLPALIEVSQSYIDVTTALPEIDYEWVYVDKQGHEHRWNENHDKITNSYIEEFTYFCPDCRDEHTLYYRYCSVCREELHPGTKPPSMWAKYVPGIISIEAKVFGTGPAQFIEDVQGLGRIKWLKVGSIMAQGRDVSHYIGTPAESHAG